MTKGRYPKEAIRKAKKIAQERGEVRYYERGPGLHPHFSIVAPHLLAEVIMAITNHINAPLAQLEAEAAGVIGCMKMYPASQQISREVWFSSQNYTRRYFRVTGSGLIELAPDGHLLPIDVAKIGAGGTAAGAPAPATAAAGSPGSPGAQQFPAPEYPAVPAPAPEVPAPEHSGPASPAPASVPAPEHSGPAASRTKTPAPPSVPAPGNSGTETSGPETPAPAPVPAPENPVQKTSGPASPAPVPGKETAHSPVHRAKGAPSRGSAHT